MFSAHIASDRAPGLLMPADIEGAELREKLKRAERQVVVYPVRQRSPIAAPALVVQVSEPKLDYTSHSPHAVLVRHVP